MISNARCSFLIMVLVLLINIGECRSRCKEARCGPYGPLIRFPFRLKDRQPDHCGYPGFDLTCTEVDNQKVTVLDLPPASTPVKLIITGISYVSQQLEVYAPEGFISRQFLILNQSFNSPFRFEPFAVLDGITFLDCRSAGSDSIYASESPDQGIVEQNLVSCTMMFNDTSASRADQSQEYQLSLRWLKPNCSNCEAMRRKCKLKNKGIEDDVECYDDPPTKMPASTKLIAAGVPIGFILLVSMTIAFIHIYHYFKMRGEDQARIEKFLEDYNALRPTRFSYADIKRITNGFKDKLGEGSHGAVFKGRLSNEILVAVKILNNKDQGDGKDFINEVGTMGKIHHVNVVRLLGFCADGFHRALVYDFLLNGSLQKFICSPGNKDIFLGWEKLQEIALGIAKGIEYLHQGCDHRILHFDINPHNVLLDDSLTPKITDFGLAKLCSKNQSIVSMTTVRGTLGYIAPEVFSRNFGNVSYKSDIYSYGMLLLEMVGGRKNLNMSVEENLQVLYPDWIHNLLEGEEIHIHIDDKGDIEIAKKLAIVGLWCIQWHPIERPSMRTVIQMLEGEADKLKIPSSPFDTSTSTSASAITSTKRLNLDLEVIHELE